MQSDNFSRPESYDVVIVGAGFAGLYALHRFRGLGLNARVIEAGGDVGGTWYWNRYPGCRCDVESLEYSYSFSEELQQSWSWSERYAPQAEILEYVRHVADRFHLRQDIDFHTRVVSARYDGASNRWGVTTASGRQLLAKFCIMATGNLSAGRLPHFPEIEKFEGSVLQTSSWPFEGAEFDGKTVAVMGVGSSGVQAIPLIAQQAAHLHVLMRTPNYVIPARNGAVDSVAVQAAKENYTERRALALTMPGAVILPKRIETAIGSTPEELERGFEQRWMMGGAFNFLSAFSDIQTNTDSNRLASEFIKCKIREIVEDQKTAKWLQPTHLMGTRRLCVGTDYYETYNRKNVSLVNLNEEPIHRFTARGIVAGDREIALDSIVFATGFDAITGALSAIDISGSNGISLKKYWEDGPRAYLGLMSAGFPNMFFITGPGSPSVLSNMVISIEQHVDWIADCIKWMDSQGFNIIEPQRQADADWVQHVNDLGQSSLLNYGQSWYLGSNVPGKPRIFMPYSGGVPTYREKCQSIAAMGYTGFSLV